MRRILVVTAVLLVVLVAAIVLLLLRGDDLPAEIWYPAWRDAANAHVIPVPCDAPGGRPSPGIRSVGFSSSPAGDCVVVFAYGTKSNMIRNWRLRREMGDMVGPPMDADAFYVPTGDHGRANGVVWRRFERFDGPLDLGPAVWMAAENEAKRRAASLPAPPR